jgi:hypothetical protein
VPVHDGEIRRAFRESTSGSPAARQERWKCSSIPKYYNLHKREALVERPSREQGRESVATSASSSTSAPIAETRWMGQDRTQPAGHLRLGLPAEPRERPVGLQERLLDEVGGIRIAAEATVDREPGQEGQVVRCRSRSSRGPRCRPPAPGPAGPRARPLALSSLVLHSPGRSLARTAPRNVLDMLRQVLSLSRCTKKWRHSP